jgi:hypothetical protein
MVSTDGAMDSTWSPVNITSSATPEAKKSNLKNDEGNGFCT